MRLGRSLVASALALTGSVAPVVAVPGVACAADGARAVLVVDTGSSVYRYCVALGKAKVTGIELIKLAGSQHGLDYSFGHGGAAVCRFAGTGPDGGDCFAEYPHFWGYWRGDGEGGWTWSSTGAGSTAVEDGDVEGWSWGTGDSGADHPAPPSTTFTAVCPEAKPAAPAPKQDKPKKPTPAPAPAPEPTAAAAAPAAEPADGPRERASGKTKKKGRGRQEVFVPVTPAPTPAEAGAPAAPAAARRTGGPPAAGVIGLVLAGLLVGAGGLMGRRRRASSGPSG